jgi:hypothetical protein
MGLAIPLLATFGGRTGTEKEYDEERGNQKISLHVRYRLAYRFDNKRPSL